MKTIFELRDVAETEAYDYVDRNIRSLPKLESGIIDRKSQDLQDTDVDAFRHAYTSGVFVLEYSEFIAEILGRANEFARPDNPSDKKNMDLWNNSIGRKYGKIAKNRQQLASLLKKALQNGELIITPNDPRKCKAEDIKPVDSKKPVMVLKENKSGRNTEFIDLSTSQIFDRDEFVQLIKAGKYPDYIVATVKGVLTPMSKPDGIQQNNLG